MVRIDKLAILIERTVPPIRSPILSLEQYTTPGDIAAKIALHAKLSGALDEAVVADLGAGTCRLIVPLLILGASKGYAIDVDERLAYECLNASRILNIGDKLIYIISRIKDEMGPLRDSVDLVVVNPPFGVWRRGADWEMLSYALYLNPERVYAILKSGNIEYHTRMARKRGYEARVLWSEDFPIPASMERHRSRIRWIKVDIVLFKKE
ncbi:MAG: METTL5 family protein [Desulfurococcales archaeon]|nr:METTL5 family protein [Desulfurococcales archaeon]